MEVQRLDKFISSQLPDVSRSAARSLIRGGKCSVNGRCVRAPELKIFPESDSVELCGKTVGYKKHLYIMLNKPAGVVCATRDGLSETVLQLLPPDLRRHGLFPAGRLDKDTVGFVLITDDGELAHRILSPKNHVPKRYFVRLELPLSEDAAFVFEQGVDLGEEKCLPAVLQKVSPTECYLTIREGKYHQIKRMFASLENKVTYLKRVSIAGVELDPELFEGQARQLTADEEKALLSGK